MNNININIHNIYHKCSKWIKNNNKINKNNNNINPNLNVYLMQMNLLQQNAIKNVQYEYDIK